MIPGVETIHPRSSWCSPPCPPITGPPTTWSLIRATTAHYTAADNLIDGDPGESADNLPAYLRSIQASYVAARGYSVGYWWAVDWLGGAWQLRGWEFQSAANLGRLTGSNANPWTAPVLYLVDGADRLTAEAARTGRLIAYEAGRRAGRYLGRPRPHSALDPTGCPGDGIRLDISLGLLDPEAPPVPPPPPPTPSPIPTPTPPQVKGRPVLYVIRPAFATATASTEWLVKFSDGHIERALGSTVAYANTGAVPIVDEASEEHYRYQLARRVLPPLA